MILIFSVEVEFSTCDIIDWLKYNNKDFIRINADEKTPIKVDLSINEEGFLKIILEYKNKIIDLDKVSSFWYRRGRHFSFYNGEPIKEIFNSKEFIREIKNDIINESKTLSEFIHYQLTKRNYSIGSLDSSCPNKLIMLDLAIKSGLLIPDTSIISTKNRIRELIKINGQVITKAIGEGLHFKAENKFYSVYTELIEKLDDFSDSFFPSLFQKNLEKKYEIRAFFLDGDIYSMAIFSQKNLKTVIDFRKYDEVTPNRNVPYKLPNEVENKIRVFMKKMNLNTGSLDFIYTKKKEYVFLEVNPVGQFGMVSVPCNYYLERKLTEKLIENERQQY